MERVFDGKYHWNEEMYEWERADKEQWYKGCRIVTVTSHQEMDHLGRIYNHRFYEITTPDGHVGQIGINKRGGNIVNVKQLIDYYEEEHKAGF